MRLLDWRQANRRLRRLVGRSALIFALLPAGHCLGPIDDLPPSEKTPNNQGETLNVGEGYQYLNQVRLSAGMSAFSVNTTLETAAQNHADYLYYNNLSGHSESSQDPYFTGVSPWDRALAAGYPTSYVSENVSINYNGFLESVDLLMSAIYHRFGFLAFHQDEVGVGFNVDSYVYNMGNSKMRGLCEGSQLSGSGLYYLSLCSSGIQIWESDYNAAFENIRTAQPDIVFWPPNQSSGVSPVFYEESPDPLPDYSVSGYPASLQFNPAFHSSISMTSFLLYRSDDTLVGNTRVLTEASDPNARFSNLEYALFPLERLDFNSTYRAEFSYVENGITQTLVWSFTTKDLGVSVYTISGSSATITLPAGSRQIALYVPPTPSYPTLSTITWSYSVGMDINLQYEDSNTILLNISASAGDSADFFLNADSVVVTVKFI